MYTHMYTLITILNNICVYIYIYIYMYTHIHIYTDNDIKHILAIFYPPLK